MSWKDIIKVEDTPIGDMEQYERDAVRRDNENEDMRFEGWPQNKAELKEELEKDLKRMVLYSEFWSIVEHDGKNATIYRKEINNIMKLIKDIDNAFPEDKLTGITNPENKYGKQMENPVGFRMNDKLQRMKRLIDDWKR